MTKKPYKVMALSALMAVFAAGILCQPIRMLLKVQ